MAKKKHTYQSKLGNEREQQNEQINKSGHRFFHELFLAQVSNVWLEEILRHL